MRIMKLGDALRDLASQMSVDRGRAATALEIAMAIGNGTTAEVRPSPQLVRPDGTHHERSTGPCRV